MTKHSTVIKGLSMEAVWESHANLSPKLILLASPLLFAAVQSPRRA